MITKMRLLFIFISTALLSSCGFHLQGEIMLAPPLHQLYLQTPDPYGPLAKTLTQYLTTSHVTLVTFPAEAETQLIVLQDTNAQDLLAPSGTNQTRQYLLRVTVVFEVTNRSGQVLLSPQTLVEERPITIQSDQILGSSNEVNLFFQQMRRTLAYAMMNRLASREVTQLINHAP